MTCPSQTPVRQRWRIRGRVQGVGFRPFIYRLAQRHHLHGFVRNGSDGVTIEVQGLDADLAGFAGALRREAPPLAVIDTMTVEPIVPRADATQFVIESSFAEAPADTEVAADAALCQECRRELFDVRDRRSGYALINCMHCGPRFSIIRAVPYDRPNTTMADFALCRDCAAEYADPADRRFHAQPIACPACGPRLTLIDPRGCALPGDPVAAAAALLREGKIVAIKGLGGFHLAVRAQDDGTVAELRRRKRRDAKPFALMVRDLDEARRLVHLSPAAEAVMQSAACPIVLAPRCDAARVSGAVAPDSHRLGVMLPYTPIHHLLLAACPDPLVMTSGNVSDEPLAIDNDEAIARLGLLCDALLLHDRPIERPVDDSVCLDVGGDLLPVRRARGFAPGCFTLPITDGSAGLCVGGELKNTVAVVRHGQAMMGPHIGDLKHPASLAVFRRTLDDLMRLYQVQPAWIAADLHPAYLSTRHADDLASRWGVPLVAVQHHHAHAAALLAERGATGPILALVCDGAGYGDDGQAWGGELLAADLVGYTRLAHLRPLRLAGGDAAAIDTRRGALGLLHQAMGTRFLDHPATARLYPDADERELLGQMMLHNVHCVASTAMGRLFDAAAALLGLCACNTFEAQAPMRLESVAAAWRQPTPPPSRRGYDPARREVDLSWLVEELLDDRPVSQRAAIFHDAAADAWSQAILHAHEQTGLTTVGLTGGVAANARFTTRLTEQLRQHGLTVWTHRHVPANDGGLALGQAAVASAQLTREGSG